MEERKKKKNVLAHPSLKRLKERTRTSRFAVYWSKYYHFPLIALVEQLQQRVLILFLDNHSIMSKRPGNENGEEAVTKKNNPQLGDPLNMLKWIDENKSSFLPPVCNKLM